MSTARPRPLCLVVLPTGAGPDLIYADAVAPALQGAGLTPVREDAADLDGAAGERLLERVLMSELAVLDVSPGATAAAYALGLRRAVRPGATVAIAQAPAPGLLTPLVYGADAGSRARLRAELATELAALTAAGPDRAREVPHALALARVVGPFAPPELARLKTDLFRQRVAYAPEVARALAAARASGEVGMLHRVRETLEPLGDAEAGALVDLVLSHRALSDWEGLIALCDALPEPLARTVLVREQLGLALNRAGRGEEAAARLRSVVADQGPSSETQSLLGRVFKDRWRTAAAAGETEAAGRALDEAIAEYSRGFEADSRDAYPGINAANLLDVRGDAESLARRDALIPVVRFAVERRVAGGAPDYWDHATLLELAVLAGDEASATRHLRDALAVAREPWEPESTAATLKMVRAARAGRETVAPWLDAVVAALEARSV